MYQGGPEALGNDRGRLSSQAVRCFCLIEGEQCDALHGSPLGQHAGQHVSSGWRVPPILSPALGSLPHSNFFSKTLKRLPVQLHYPVESKNANRQDMALSAISVLSATVCLRILPRNAPSLTWPSIATLGTDMPSPLGTTSATSLQPALELIYLAKLQPELASQSLRKLLLANPNYFENLPESSFKVVLNMNGDTAFESLGCVSYIALLDQLYASVQLKRDWGYSSGLDNSSSRQYVRFYLSFDRGVTWQNEGLTACQCLRRARSQTAYPSRDKADRTSRTTQVRFTRTPGSRNSLLEFASSSGRPRLDPALGQRPGNHHSHHKARWSSDGLSASRVLGPIRR